MNSKPALKLDWCSFEAAKYAVEHWHYSQRMPAGKLVKIGVWENAKFIGCIIFGRGATPEIGKPYNLTQMQICELVRVALAKGHKTPTSKCLAIAINIIRKHMPKIRMIVSFADSSQGHHGGIYQATNWVCAGASHTHVIVVNGAKCHPRSLGAKYGKGGQSIPWLHKHVDPKAKVIYTPPKYRYLMPLDDDMRTAIQHLKQPYPKRLKHSGDAVPFQGTEGGLTPT